MREYSLFDIRTGAATVVRVDEAEDAPLAPRASWVNEERDRRMRSAFAFRGFVYDCDEASLQRITGAATLAGFWLGGGGDPQSTLWHGGASPFRWIAADNTVTVMDAQTVFAFGQAASANETAHIFAARALKEMSPIPEDFASDAYWPPRAVIGGGA